MHYGEFLKELEDKADPAYRDFHKKLLKDENINVLGVRIPCLRAIAKKYRANFDEVFAFPDDFYEVKFVKLTIAAGLPYEKFIEVLPQCVDLIDNWAACDCFAPACIKNHNEEFLPYLETFVQEGGEFRQRFALTTLMKFYLDEKYLDRVLNLMLACDTSLYYVHMAAAWLTAELLVKFYDFGLNILIGQLLDRKTHNKAIQKAIESFRLSDEQKNYLKGLKR